MEFRGSRREHADVSFSYYKDKADTSVLKASDFSDGILPHKYYNDMVKGKGDPKTVLKGKDIKEKVSLPFLPYGKYHASRNDERFLQACLKDTMVPFKNVEQVIAECYKRLTTEAFVCFYYYFLLFFSLFLLFFSLFLLFFSLFLLF